MSFSNKITLAVLSCFCAKTSAYIVPLCSHNGSPYYALKCDDVNDNTSLIASFRTTFSRKFISIFTILTEFVSNITEDETPSALESILIFMGVYDMPKTKLHFMFELLFSNFVKLILLCSFFTLSFILVNMYRRISYSKESEMLNERVNFVEKFCSNREHEYSTEEEDEGGQGDVIEDVNNIEPEDIAEDIKH